MAESNFLQETSAKQSKNDHAGWFQVSARCSEPAPAKVSPWRLVLLGSPGVGKGTQAFLLNQRFKACHLSTGDLLRAASKQSECEQSPAMKAAMEHMRRGELVPDDIVLDMVAERIGCLRCCGGFLLDGFPRTVAQAEALEKLMNREKLALTAVLNYELPVEEIVARLGGRRTCSSCKAVFHVTDMPPRVEGVCDHCGKKLFQREDDRPEAIRVRLATYEKSTKPLMEFYQKRGLLVTVMAGKVPEETFQRTMVKLAALSPS